jgi:GNAT superfamily N-acetyltransferase
MAEVRLDPMSAVEYAAWRERAVAYYADDHVAAGNWPRDEALARSEAEFDRYLPAGTSTPENWLWTIRDQDGAGAGILWVARSTQKPDMAFIYDITIADERQGHGLGSATLRWLDDWAREHGFASIGLHVFAFNHGARRLYQRMGYVETDIQMAKQL